jgi:hypothetical protein
MDKFRRYLLSNISRYPMIVTLMGFLVLIIVFYMWEAICGNKDAPNLL